MSAAQPVSPPTDYDEPTIAARNSFASPTKPVDDTDGAAVSPWVSLFANPRLLFVVLFGCFGGLLFGYDTGVIGGVSILDGFRAEFGLTLAVSGVADPTSTANMISWIVSSFTLGAAAGATFAGPLSDRLSRRWTVLTGAIIFTIGGALQAGAVHIVMLFAGRIVAGIAIGILSTVIPIYNSELASPEVRGIMNTLFQLAITFGILVAFLLNLGFQTIYSGWRGSLAMQCFFSLILVIGIGILPESPRWLLIMHRDEKARNVLNRLRVERHVDPEKAAREAARAALGAMNLDDDPSKLVYDPKTRSITLPQVGDGDPVIISAANIHTNIDQEMEEMRSSIAIQEKIGEGTWAQIFGKELRMRMWVGTGVQGFQQLTGVNAIFYYAPEIFSNVGVSSLQSTAVTGVVNFVATFIAIGFIDGVGRVPLLIAGAAGMLICALIVALVSLLAAANTASGDLVIVFICLFVVNFAYSWGPCGWIIPSEIYPQSLRGKAVSVTTTVNWLGNFAIAQATPHLLSAAGVGPTFFLFAGFLVMILIFVILSVPETRGVSLEKMDLMFHVETYDQWLRYTRYNVYHALYLFFPCWINDTERFDYTAGQTHDNDNVAVNIKQLTPNGTPPPRADDDLSTMTTKAQRKESSGDNDADMDERTATEVEIATINPP